MSDMFPQLDRYKVEVDSDVKGRHLAAIGSELRRQPPGRRFGGRAFAVAVALVLLLPVIAVAAENSVPGDFFYPLKIWVEPAVVIVDPDAPAENRVREVEVLLERDAPATVVDEGIAAAWEEVADDPDLEKRIVLVEEEMDQRHPDRPSKRDRRDHEPHPDEPKAPHREPDSSPHRPGRNKGAVAPGDPAETADSTTTTTVGSSTTTAQTGSSSTTAPRADTRNDR